MATDHSPFTEVPEHDNHHTTSHMTVTQEDFNSDEPESPTNIRDSSLSPKTHVPADVHDAPTKRVRELFGHDFDKDFTDKMPSFFPVSIVG